MAKLRTKNNTGGDKDRASPTVSITCLKKSISQKASRLQKPKQSMPTIIGHYYFMSRILQLASLISFIKDNKQEDFKIESSPAIKESLKSCIKVQSRDKRTRESLVEFLTNNSLAKCGRRSLYKYNISMCLLYIIQKFFKSSKSITPFKRLTLPQAQEIAGNLYGRSYHIDLAKIIKSISSCPDYYKNLIKYYTDGDEQYIGDNDVKHQMEVFLDEKLKMYRQKPSYNKMRVNKKFVYSNSDLPSESDKEDDENCLDQLTNDPINVEKEIHGHQIVTLSESNDIETNSTDARIITSEPAPTIVNQEQDNKVKTQPKKTKNKRGKSKARETKHVSEFKPGDLVLAKWRKCDFWPGYIKKSIKRKTQFGCLVYFFNTEGPATFIPDKNIKKKSSNEISHLCEEKNKENVGVDLKKAYREAKSWSKKTKSA